MPKTRGVVETTVGKENRQRNSRKRKNDGNGGSEIEKGEGGGRRVSKQRNGKGKSKCGKEVQPHDGSYVINWKKLIYVSDSIRKQRRRRKYNSERRSPRTRSKCGTGKATCRDG